MRTTVTLDPDSERLIREAVAARGQSFKRVLNEAIRAGLGGTPSVARSAASVIPVFRSGYVAWIDRSRLQQLSDEMETEAFPAGPPECPGHFSPVLGGEVSESGFFSG